MPEPIAFYHLNERYEVAERENRQPKGILGDVAITNGPYKAPGGAYMFHGTVSSYIEFPNTGGLDTRFSITLMCWIQHEGQDGPFLSYGKDSLGVWIGIAFGNLFLIVPRNNPKEDWHENLKLLTSAHLPPKGLWFHVAATYDHNTFLSSLFINGHSAMFIIVSDTSVGIPSKDFVISTNAGEVRMGATNYNNGYFKGKIAEKEGLRRCTEPGSDTNIDNTR